MLLWAPMLGNDANNANFQGSSKAQLNEKISMSHLSAMVLAFIIQVSL